MLKIGERIDIEIVNDIEVRIYFDNILVEGVEQIDLKFCAGRLPYQECTVIVTDSSKFNYTMDFAEEIVKCGVNTEVLCMFGDFRQIECTLKDGNFTKDVKTPILRDSVRTTKTLNIPSH